MGSWLREWLRVGAVVALLGRKNAREQWRSRHDHEELALRCRAYLAAHHAPEAVLRGWLDVLAIEPPVAEVNSPAEIELTCVG